MALVRCRECNERVSTEAETCPHCGIGLPGLPLPLLEAKTAVLASIADLSVLWQTLARRGGRLVQIAALLFIALVGWRALDYWIDRDIAAEQRRFDDRAFELAARAFVPGSPLACLDTIAGEIVEEACEKALFASAESTAAAVTYVSAQLSLLAAANDRAQGRPSYGEGIAGLRRTVEADRFGIAAYVLAAGDACTPDNCRAFAFLETTGRIHDNLVERQFEARLKRAMASWRPSSERAEANAAPATAGVATPVFAARPPHNVYYPSAASIPPVSIMAAEPPARDPRETTRAPEPPPAVSRKPPVALQQPRQPAAAAPAAPVGPLQLVPGAQ